MADYCSKTAVVILPKDKNKPFHIGKNCWIGHFCVLDGSEGLSIGHGCSIASGVHIYSHSTHLETTLLGKRKTGRVMILDHVAIGANSIIHYDCTIYSYAVIGALSNVLPHTTIKEHEFWSGNPAKFVRKLK